jgi:hypothetical protein
MNTIPMYEEGKSHSRHRPQARKDFFRKPRHTCWHPIEKQAA